MNPRANKSILVVDDDPRVVLAIQKRLEHAGYQVQTATRPDQALRLARCGVDAITLDCELQAHLNGIQLARTLSCDRQTRNIPIVFITGRADPEFETLCNAVGAHCFLSKPYDGQVLVQLLDNLFARDELAQVQQISRAKRRQPMNLA